MPALTIKHIPDRLYRRLLLSAQVNQRSLNSELIHCLEIVLLPKKADTEALVSAARVLRGQVKVRSISVENIQAAKIIGSR